MKKSSNTLDKPPSRPDSAANRSTEMNTGISTGLRFVALIVDLGVCYAIFFGSFMLMGTIMDHGPDWLGLILFLAIFPVSFLSPLLYLGFTTGYWGRTLGKWVCRLKVVDDSGRRLGFWKGLGREAFKILMLVSHIGAIILAIQVILGNRGFHDSLCGTDVEFTGGLTSTQKAWRKNYGRN